MQQLALQTNSDSIREAETILCAIVSLRHFTPCIFVFSCFCWHYRSHFRMLGIGLCALQTVFAPAMVPRSCCTCKQFFIRLKRICLLAAFLSFSCTFLQYDYLTRRLSLCIPIRESYMTSTLTSSDVSQYRDQPGWHRVTWLLEELKVSYQIKRYAKNVRKGTSKRLARNS